MVPINIMKKPTLQQGQIARAEATFTARMPPDKGLKRLGARAQDAGSVLTGAGNTARMLPDAELKRLGIVKAADGKHYRATLHIGFMWY
jgi:hypothetical protein